MISAPRHNFPQDQKQGRFLVIETIDEHENIKRGQRCHVEAVQFSTGNLLLWFHKSRVKRMSDVEGLLEKDGFYLIHYNGRTAASGRSD